MQRSAAQKSEHGRAFVRRRPRLEPSSGGGERRTQRLPCARASAQRERGAPGGNTHRRLPTASPRARCAQAVAAVRTARKQRQQRRCPRPRRCTTKKRSSLTCGAALGPGDAAPARPGARAAGGRAAQMQPRRAFATLLLGVWLACAVAQVPVQAPAFPLSSQPMASDAVFAATLAKVAAAWPNTTWTTPLTCGTNCSFDALVMQPIRCASARIYAATVGGADVSGFARLWPNATAAVAAVAALPEGGAYPVAWWDTTSVLTGANIWLLNWFNLTLPMEVPVSVDVVRPPDALWDGGRVSSTVLDSYLLDTLGYDCVADASAETPEGSLYKMFAHPHQTFSYTVLATLPVREPERIISRLFTWLKPFTANVWGGIVACFVFSALLMSYFEMGEGTQQWELGHFGNRDGSKPGITNVLAQGLYTSMTHFVTSNNEQFIAVTLPGRAYLMAYSFTIMLIVSSYVANLAAVLSQPPPSSAVISAFGDFGAKNVRACALNNSEVLSLINEMGPTVTAKLPLVIIDSTRPSDLLAAIRGNGTHGPLCGGGVIANLDGLQALGPAGDPTGAACANSLVGPPLNQGLYALAFNRNFNRDQLLALNGLISYAVLSGAYDAAQAGSNTFGAARTNCAVVALMTDVVSASLTLTQFAGVFLILLIGALIAITLKCVIAARTMATNRRGLPLVDAAGFAQQKQRPGGQPSASGRRRRSRSKALRESGSGSELASAPVSLRLDAPPASQSAPPQLAEEQGGSCFPQPFWAQPAAAPPPASLRQQR